MECIPGTF